MIHWVELCAGAAATSLRLLGGPSCEPLVGWMGGKRRFAGGILAALGVQRRDVRSALLVDAGSWGWVWPTVLDPVLGPEVASVLEGWRDEDPVALWFRLAAQDLPEDPVAAAAHWLWMQGRAASNVPVWWEPDGWTKGQHPGQQQRQTATQRGVWRQGEKTKAGVRATACQSGTGRGRLNGLRSPATVGARIRCLHACIRHPVAVSAASVHDLEVPHDASRHVVYFDPPYQGCTGYSVQLDREAVIGTAERWAAAGAVVAVSEAEPLPLPGWHHIEITSLGRRNCKPEWLTMSREPAWRPAEQMALLTGATP